MGFLSTLLGSGGHTRSYYSDPQKIQQFYDQFLGLMQGPLGRIAQQALGGAASFGPGFQGNTGLLAQQAIAPYLASILGQAVQAGTPTVVQEQGMPGLLQTALGGLAGGAGVGIGASLFGGTPKLPATTQTSPLTSLLGYNDTGKLGEY